MPYVNLKGFSGKTWDYHQFPSPRQGALGAEKTQEKGVWDQGGPGNRTPPLQEVEVFYEQNPSPTSTVE